jgi:flagellar biogenesis protein FliO
MERDIRKQRQETMYAQREARRHFVEAIAFVFLGLIAVGFIALVAWLFTNRGTF